MGYPQATTLGKISMINKEITVKDLRDKIANTSPAKPRIIEPHVSSVWKPLLPNPKEDELRGDRTSKMGEGGRLK